jgi:hypothetical protein
MADMFANRKVTNYIINHLEKNGLSAPVQRATQSDSHYITAKLPSEHHDALEESGFDFNKTRKIRISDHANPSSHSDYSIRTDADEHKNYGWRTLANQILNDFKPELSFISKLPKKPKTQTEPQQLALPQIGSKVSHRSFGEGTVVGYTPNGVSVSFNGNEQSIHPAYLSQISKADGGLVEDQGITAYHGSPYKFDRFDLSKIGTGEGAQAYGHGLYFAEAEPTARQYRDALSTKLLGNIGGQGQTDWDNPEHVAASWLKIYKTPEAAIDYLESLPEQHKTPVTKQAAELLKSNSALPETPAGHMYEVSINAHPDHFLDWDKPLSEQSEHVKNVVSNVIRDAINDAANPNSLYAQVQGARSTERADPENPMEMSGAAIHDMLSRVYGHEMQSKKLLEHGIKGIKYLDAGSRNVTPAFDPSYLERQIFKNREEHKNAVSNQQRQELDEDHQTLLQRLDDAKKEKHLSRNYVVFDDKLVNVKRQYARGGRIGYADGGSPSISDRIFTFAETLPTTEENIEYLKKFGRDVGEGAYDLSKRVISGFAKRAEQASERTPPPNVRAGERPVYVEPKREAPPQRRYILPDGRMGSKAELDLSNEMAKERFEEQYATPRVVQENMPSLDRPAPTRAPFRDKLQRQEQQANVDRPVVLPERKGFDWPQVYKDIMSDEPQMEWTKGMTPREQAPPPPPPPSSGGSILGGVGEGQGGHRYVEGGPLELTVGGNRPQIEPRDVYIPSNDTPNPFHSHQTMVASAPEYEGQVVPIPDTPEDRMGEYHLPRLIWPLHELKSREGYKAKEGLEDYNPPMSATGERFPSQRDVNLYRDVDATYGRPEAGYLQQGARGSYYDDLTEMTSRRGGYRRTMAPQESDAFNAAYIAAQRNPIAALGFRPEEFDFSGNPIPQTTAGSVSPTSSRIYADLKFPSVAVHEAIHRGLVEIGNEDYNAYRAKTDSLLKEMNDLTTQPYSPEKSKRFFEIGDELDALRKQRTNPDIFPAGQITDPEGKEDEQELFVRSLMYKMFGPVEGYEMERQLVNGDVIKAYPPEKLERFMIDNADRIGRLEQRALSMLQERAADRERGPRASGGAVRGEYALGGNPADRLGGGYGTGNIGGGSSISSGGGMAEARAADRASVSGYSADSGRGSSGGGSGGGRDSSPSIDRGTSKSDRDRYDSGALRPGGNIGAELVKGAVSNRGMFSPSIDMPMQFGMGVRQAGFPTQQTGPMDPRNQGYAEQMAKSAREAYLQSTRPIDPTSSENAYNFREPFVGGISDERIAEIQRQLNEPIGQPMGPVKPQAALPDSAFGRTLIDPTGKYTQDALGQMKTASDGISMLNSPTLAGAFVRAFTPTPTPATPQQQAAIERMYRRDLNTSVPANFATPEGMTQRYGAPGATPLARPGQTSTAYLSAGPSASTGRQDMPVRSTSTAPSPSSNQTPKQNFGNAFSEARARGDETFSWTNPKTGQTMRYTTKLQRKSGGRVPSINEHEQWIAEPLKPRNVAKVSKPRKTSKVDETAIVKRATMLSSRKS